MPSLVSLDIITGPGKWDYFMAVCEPNNRTVSFTVADNRIYEVVILEDGVRASNVRVFVGVTRVDNHPYWVTGAYAVGAPKGSKGGIALYGMVRESDAPRLPGFGPLDFDTPSALRATALDLV